MTDADKRVAIDSFVKFIPKRRSYETYDNSVWNWKTIPLGESETNTCKNISIENCD